MANDPITDRFQIQFQMDWQMFPAGEMTWWEWLFDPFGGLTLPGQTLSEPYTQLPNIHRWGEAITTIDPDTGDVTALHWVSRAFWLRGGCRILGLDVGFGIAWRKKVSEKRTGDE